MIFLDDLGVPHFFCEQYERKNRFFSFRSSTSTRKIYLNYLSKIFFGCHCVVTEWSKILLVSVVDVNFLLENFRFSLSSLLCNDIFGRSRSPRPNYTLVRSYSHGKHQKPFRLKVTNFFVNNTKEKIACSVSGQVREGYILISWLIRRFKPKIFFSVVTEWSKITQK